MFYRTQLIENNAKEKALYYYDLEQTPQSIGYRQKTTILFGLA